MRFSPAPHADRSTDPADPVWPRYTRPWDRSAEVAVRRVFSTSSLAILIALVGCDGCSQNGDKGKPDDTAPSFYPGETAADLTEHGVIECDNPGLRSTRKFNLKTSPSPPNSDLWLWGGGLIVGDLDGDGHHDVVLPHETMASSLYLGTGNDTFEERPDLLVDFDLSFGTGGTMVDYDGDGDLDIYITRFSDEELGADGANRLLRNDGNLQFTDVAEFAGVTGCDLSPRVCYKSMSSTWADYDRDGDLDLLVGNYGFVDESGPLAAEFLPAEPSFLYANNGDGTFTDVTATQMPWNPVHDGYTYVSSFIDLDGDFWPEIYFINDFGASYPNALVLNDQGTLKLDNHARGMDLPMTGMGLGVGDLNDDGLPDLLIPEWQSIRLLQSAPEYGLWVDIQTYYNGLTPQGVQKVPWGGEFVDIDLDGDLDAVVAYGMVANENPIWSSNFEQPDALYIQEAGGIFVDQATSWGVADIIVGRGFASADFNEDGYPDLAKRDLAGAEVLHMSVCGDSNWLEIELRQPDTMNTYAVGAVVDVVANGRTMRRWMMAGGLNYASAPPLELHYGLSTSETADEIVVWWPDGTDSRFYDVTAKQKLTITRN